MEMGGRLQAFLSLVVAISSTLAIKECSVAPLKRLIFHTSACFFESYLALPASAVFLSNLGWAVATSKPRRHRNHNGWLQNMVGLDAGRHR